ncbi:MAG: LCP family protein [Lachnospiraceae bacterium]|nr:LCP family protein [Lachnospiraceae bacterium]
MKKIKAMKSAKKRKNAKVIGMILGGLAGIVLILFVVWLIISKIGENSLYATGNAEGNGEIVNISYLSNEELADVMWRPGKVRYQGKVYEYNDKILTFLIMGVDKEGPLIATEEEAAGGQSDALFLALLNPETKSIDVLAVDRNLITTLTLPKMGENGEDAYTEGQITLQYGYGDGREGSCELTKETVSSTLYNLPIHGYAAIGYSAIPYLNDSVGGVEVTITKDVLGDTHWTEGERVVLYGHEAIIFIRYRDTTIFESARLRTMRQKEYLSAFVNQLFQQSKEDITLPIRLYQGVQEYIVTDLSADEILFLAEEVIDYNFSEVKIHTMPGETVQGEVYEEFYPNENELRELMLELYYTQVTETEE